MTLFKPASLCALGTFAAALSLVSMPALAHTGGSAFGGAALGFMHPFLGLDHLLAMVAAGLFASQLGGRALWMIPAAFVALMVLGGGLGIAAFGLPFIETGIALSVVVLGAAVALRIKTPVALAMGLVGVFAVFHGHAHGSEMMVGVSSLAYSMGFIAATVGLHTAGIGLGLLANRLSDRLGTMAARATGVVVAATGLAILGAV